MSKRKGTSSSSTMRRRFEKASNCFWPRKVSTDTAATVKKDSGKSKRISTTSVLLDLMLPGKSGMDVQKDIKRVDPTLPVVIITAMGV